MMRTDEIVGEGEHAYGCGELLIVLVEPESKLLGYLLVHPFDDIRNLFL